MAAITTSPWPRSKFLPFDRHALAGLVRLAVFLVERLGERAAAALASGTRSCGRFGPASDGSTSPRSSSSVSVNTGSGVSASRYSPCALAYFSTSAMRALLARRRLEIGERLLVDGEEAAGRAIFRRHVGDGGAVLERQIGEAGAEELDELADHAARAQHLGDGEHEIGRGHAVAQARRSGGSRPLRGSASRSAGRASRLRPRCRRRPSRAPRAR